jgi:glycosyltransferase involved in cell wall biosynthesis
MTFPIVHIVICLCTYKRPTYLERLLNSLTDQTTDGVFTYSIVLVDNDRNKSAQNTYNIFKDKSSINIKYHVEPEQNIALARNRAVMNAKGDFVAFIDDDEFPERNWLITLYQACNKFNADGILGPVIPHYEIQPPKWILKGKFYERPSHRTGELLHWTNTRTGNVMLRKNIFINGNMFNPEFGMGGEDRDFFRRMIDKGFRFIWCDEAPVYESVSAVRCKRSFMLKRALLRGKIPHFSLLDIVKSLVAIPLYSSILPILILLGHHRFMKYLIKDFDHIGRILAFCGIDVIKQKYVTE